MKFNKVILGLILILAAVGCGDKKNQEQEPQKTVRPDPDSEYGYYKRFIFDGDTCSSTNRTYKFAGSAYFSVLQSDPRYRLNVRMYLDRNHSYSVNFQVKSFDTITNSFETTVSFWRGGRWSIDAGNLILDGVGDGYPVTYDGVPAVLLQIKDNYPGKMFDRSNTVLIPETDRCS